MKDANYTNVVVLVPTINYCIYCGMSSVQCLITNRMNQCNSFTTSSIVLLLIKPRRR